MNLLYLICGVSGSGKSWACRQVANKFHYVPHDRCWKHPTLKPQPGEDPKWVEGAESTHVETLMAEAKRAEKPLLTECPFAERHIKERLEKEGFKVVPVFVIEPPRVVAERYFRREKKQIPKAAYTRAQTIVTRAIEWRAFSGSSEKVLEYLQKV